MKFRIHYNTRWGESLCLVSGDAKFPMEWAGNGFWELCVTDNADNTGNTSDTDGTGGAQSSGGAGSTGNAESTGIQDLLEDYFYVVVEDGLIRLTEWEHHHRKNAAKVETTEETANAAKEDKDAEAVTDKWIDCPIEGCRFPRKHSAAIFDAPGFRGAGTAVPVFSLRTEDDFGIGDFRDLRPLVDWAAETGQCVLQLLPINDTTREGGWGDSYPYSPVSSFALNPMYIRLQDVGIRETAAFKKLRAELNALPELDYPRVFREKTALLRGAFEKRGAKDLASPAFAKFQRDNAEWLDEYCRFCAMRDGVVPEYYAWVQFHLDRQLGEEVRYAHGKGVYLKGDLPIGVGRDSADAYWHPELFNLDSSAGAPPDYFSADGQNWGFPTYNWEAMARDGYAWWKARLRKMAEYFDAFRIDHILGFFRIWEIPVECRSGMDGHFNPALPYSPEEIAAAGLPLEGLFHEDPRNPGMYQPLITPSTDKLCDWQRERFGAMYNDFFYRRNEDLWRRNAERKLPELLGATGMLACGEDLGMVPDCVAGVMDREKILSLRMRGFDFKGEWGETSVCATSSHDMDTLRMQCGGNDPSPEDCRRMLLEFLQSPSMLAIFPLQDWLSADGNLRNPDRGSERINHPEDPNHHWRYRLHFDLRELGAARDFNGRVASMISETGRTVSHGEKN